MPFAFPELPTLPELIAPEPMQMQMPALQMPDLQMQMPAMPNAGDMMAQMQAQMQSQMQMQMAQMQQVHQQMPSMMSSMGAGFPNLGGMPIDDLSSITLNEILRLAKSCILEKVNQLLLH